MSQISSSSSLNYMDKVPVKISEKYKPPPKISLSYNNINQRLNNLNELLESDLIKYDFSLERNVLVKIQEWKTVRNKEREHRRERVRKYELNRLREIEEKQKQLLTAVSYPSADDLSSDDEEPTEHAKTTTALGAIESLRSAAATNGIQSKDSTTTVTNACSAAAANASDINDVNTGNVQFSPSHQNFNTILTPTVVPDPVLNSIHNDVHNSINYKINYSDFENDTSSPFDNIELKTINDLDILAQVLNISSQKHSNISTSTNDEANTNSSNITSDISSKSVTNTAITVDNNKIDEVVKTGENQSNLSANNISNLNDNYQYSNLVKITNDRTLNEYYYNSSLKNDGTADISSQILLSNANNFYPISSVSSTNTQQQQTYNSTLNAITTTTANMNEIISRRNIDFYNLCNNLPNNQNYDNYLYRNYPLDYGNYSNNPHHTIDIDSSNNSFHNQDVNAYQQIASYTVTPNQNTLHSIYNGDNIPNTASTTIFGLNSSNKSKSVPDILKELNDEIRDSEMKRNERRRFQDLESYENRQLLLGNSNSNKKYDDTISDTFMKLSPSSQVLAKNISLMGFPLERVCKIAEMYGNDDKKIVEHLIPLSELLDLGFDETKISEALLKFDNNKEKALDFLIS